MVLKKVNRRKLIISNGLILCSPTADEITAIKHKLTFDNPAYRNAIRFSKYNRVSIPPSLMYYEQGKYNGEPCIKMPIGFDLASVVEDYSELKIIDERVYTQINHAPFVLTLRDDQKEAGYNYLHYNKDRNPIRSIIQLPTGKGKSILGLFIASQLSCKTLIVVHKDDLVDGWKKDIELSFGGKVCPGLIKAKSREIGHFLTIATVQTLNRLSPDELDNLYNTFGLVIQDEMHHCPASSYSVVSNFRPRYRLGLTATPERTDGLDHIMNLYYGNFCYKYVNKKEEEDTDILPVKVIKQKSSLYFNPLFQNVGGEERHIYKLIDLYATQEVEMKSGYIRLSDIPYNERPSLSYQTVDSFVVNNESYKEMVCHDIINEYAKGHSCIVFFTQKEHCRTYYDYLKMFVDEEDLGLYYGDNSDNKSVLEKADKKRKFITLTTYAKATEGTNVKTWEVEFLVSSINNEKNTEQAVGRIRRAKEGKLNPAILYDYRVPFVYSLANHGSTRDRRYRQLGFISEGDNPLSKRSIFKRGY